MVSLDKLDDMISGLPPEARAALLDDAMRQLARNKIADYRPYPKQREFHLLGATMRERLLRAGNQCVTPWTFIETADGLLRSEEAFFSEDVRVVALAGESECVAQAQNGFLVGIEPAYRFVMESGEFFDCSASHQVATERGYLRIDQIMSLSSGRHCWHRAEDYQANCVEDGYLCDPQLLTEEGIFRELPQAQAYALNSTLSFSQKDVAERISLCTSLSLQSFHQTIADDAALQRAALFSQFAGPASHKSVLSLTGYSRILQQPEIESSRLQSGNVLSRVKSSAFFRAIPWSCQLVGAEDMLGLHISSIQEHGRSLDALSLGCSLQELHRDESRIATFYPYKHPELIGRKRIIAVVPIGFQPLLDVQIEDVHNYKSAGVYHHNCGKSFSVGAEVSYHLTGLYPDWWDGRRWARPTVVWASGETAEATRDNPQRVLLGLAGEKGTGSIPADCLGGDYGMASGTADLFDYIKVRHHTNGVFDGWSFLRFKYYAQGRKKWQGPPVDFVWFDEEPPEEIYDEGLARTIATGGMAAMSFTPLQGMSTVVLRFLGKEKTTDRADVNMTIEDAEHISPEERVRIIASFPAHEREARAKGIPTLGSGRIFPVEEDSIKVAAFPIPDHWAQINGIDFGWDHPAAAARLAWDRDADCLYLINAHRAREQTPILFAPSVKAWGDWIPVSWPHDGLQHDKGSGEQLAEQYREAGLNMLPERATWEDGSNGVEAGVLEMLDRMQTGRFKVFAHLDEFFEEFRLYHRKDGKIVKEMDDIISACLHQDTRVITRFGAQRIVDLVGSNGEVLSAGGEWMPYNNCRKTREQAELVMVTFEDGYELLCTPDHKILSESGEWVAAIDSAGVVCHNAVSRSKGIKWTKSFTAESDLPALEDISVVQKSFFIGRFGKTLTEKFQMATMFITKMVTGITTPLKTFAAFQEKSICRSTTRDTKDDQTLRLRPWLSGEKQMQVNQPNTRQERETSTSFAKRLSSFVIAVEKSLCLNQKGVIGFAQTHVDQSSAAKMERTLLLLFAECADRNICQTDSGQAKHAQYLVQKSYGLQLPKAKSTSRVLQVKSAGRSDVYCMEVPVYQAFAVENGVVVHNCRYALMMKRFARVPPRADRRAHRKERDWRTA